MAKHATSFPIDDNQHVPPDRKTVYKRIDKLMMTKWQHKYDNTTIKTWYKQLEPIVSNKIKFTAKTRHEENEITRIRFECYRSRDTLYKMKQSNDDKCANCPTEVETLTHLLTCHHNNIIDTSGITDPHRQRDNIITILADSKKCHQLYLSL